MAYSVNKVIILGNVGKDPEVRYTKSGTAVTSFSVATSERRGGQQAEERTEWHNVVAWDKLAELCGRLIGKGNKVYVEGRLQTREYNDRDGNRRWSTEIVAREMVFLTTRDGGGARTSSAPPPGDAWSGGSGGGGSAPQRAPAQQSGSTGSSGGGAEIPYSDDEDIPF